MADPDVISQRGQHLEIHCPDCRHSRKKGLLWLGGKDYVECPSCGGPSGGHPGVLYMWERAITPPKHFIMPGFAHSTREKIAVPRKIKE